jgi:hypothetical protein
MNRRFGDKDPRQPPADPLFNHVESFSPLPTSSEISVPLVVENPAGAAGKAAASVALDPSAGDIVAVAESSPSVEHDLAAPQHSALSSEALPTDRTEITIQAADAQVMEVVSTMDSIHAELDAFASQGKAAALPPSPASQDGHTDTGSVVHHIEAQAGLVLGSLQTQSTAVAFGIAPGVQAHETMVPQPADIGLTPATAATEQSASPATAVSASSFSQAHLENPAAGSHVGATTSAAIGAGGATAAQVEQALGESGANVNGAGVKVGVLSDSFNDLGGAAADEASGALPSASSIQVLSDLSSGGTDEGRAMMQIVHDIAPGASLAFYTADNSEQDFANGILALAAAGCKVICDDISYLDEPFFQNGIVAQAIQTVEAEGVTYVTSAGNNASNAYQAAWTPGSGTFDGFPFTDAELFGGSIAQTINVTASAADPVPLLVEWNKAYGQASFASGQAPDIDLFVFQNGKLIAQATNASVGEPNNPFTGYEFTASGTYQIVIQNNFGPNPGLIKEILAGDGLPVSISGADVGTVFGHAMTPGVITAGAVSTAATPAFGVSTPVSEPFSSSGAGTELLFDNNGTPLPSPQLLSPVALSGVDNIATTVPGGLSDFYGTSAASASLAGVATMILAANPTLTPGQVEQIMEQTALPMANSAVSGAGLAQVYAAIAAAETIGATSIESAGATSLVQVATHYFLNPVAGGTGPELIFAGAPLTAGQFGSNWTILGAEAVSAGYDVAWKNTATGLYNIWSVDSAGNYVSDLLVSAAPNSAALESFETTFHQDLNGDGIIGAPPVTIESFGSTSLVQVANNYFLDPVAGGTGPELIFDGAPLTAGQFGSSWTILGAEAVSGGYDVAWKNTATGLYNIWSVDSAGNYVSTLLASAAPNSAALESFETTFHQDLNGDGTIGIITATIEASGSTALVQVANNYFLNPVAGGTGPELIFDGAPLTAGQFGSSWTILGAEAVSAGYDVAWKNTATDLYNVWSVDSAGNYISTLLASAAPGSSALESFETVFHQDFNGDGTIGVVTTTIEASGSTALVQVANNYYLNPVAGGAGPELIFAGAPLTAGQFGSNWTILGAEAVSGGYDVAWKNTATDLYNIWSVDSAGNYVSTLLASAAPNSAALESFETVFHQDLNGDGVIGVPTTGSSTAVASSEAVTFDGTMLRLNMPAAFNYQIIGFAGDGTSAGSDRIDVSNVSFNSVHSSFDSSSGTLALSDGATVVNLQLVGISSEDGFKFADDGHGGTVISATSAQGAGLASPNSGENPAAVIAGPDTFVFARNFGHVELANFSPATDTIQFSKSVFASIDALSAATHDDTSGNAVITDAAHDVITIQHVTTAQLLAHQSDFHFV